MTESRDIEQARAKLSQLGFDPGLEPEQAVAKLASLRGTAGADNALIARVLATIDHPAAAQLLAEMESAASGAERREIRRALFKLRQRGLKPQLVAKKGEAAVARPPSDLGALLSPIDAQGTRIVWLYKPRPQGGLTRLWGLVSESEGLLNIGLATVSRKELRGEREAFERRASMKLIDADWRLADYILCEAYGMTPEVKRASVGSFLALRAELIAAPPPESFEHPAYRELGSEDAEPSVTLLAEPEISAWRLPAEALKPYVEELKSIRQSLLVVTPAQQEERIATLRARATAEALSGERARLLRRRLEESAYVMARSGRSAAARMAAAAADKIRHGADLLRISFFVALVGRQLDAMLGQERQREAEEPRLIMTPAEALRARESRRRVS